MMCCYCACILLALSYLGVAIVQNRKRDRRYGKPENVREGTGDGLGDATDKEQKESFRYTH